MYESYSRKSTKVSASPFVVRSFGDQQTTDDVDDVDDAKTLRDAFFDGRVEHTATATMATTRCLGLCVVVRSCRVLVDLRDCCLRDAEV